MVCYTTQEFQTAVAGYNRPTFARGEHDGGALEAGQTTQFNVYHSIRRSFLEQVVNAPSISFDDVYTAPSKRITGGLGIDH